MSASPAGHRNFALLLLVTVASLSNYAPLLSVVPLWVASGGGAATGVGATTAAMMGATAATQLAMGPVLRLLTLRQMLIIGALLMALATPFYLFSAALTPVLVVSAVRGVGFALLVVAGSALVAEIVPPQRLARGAGLYGLAAGLPNLIMLPLGVWAVQQWSFTPVFVTTSVLALGAVPLAALLTAGGQRVGRRAAVDPDGARTSGSRSAVRTLRPLVRPALVFFATTMALGGVVTFLPLAITDAAAASAALFASSLCMILGRTGAGMLGDRLAAGRLLLPAAVVSAAGMVGVALGSAATGGPLLGVLGAGAFGLGLGVVQNDSLVMILGRAGPGGHGTASAVWNFAYDGGTGAGAVLLGAVVAEAGYPWGFAVSAVVIALAAPAGLASRADLRQ